MLVEIEGGFFRRRRINGHLAHSLIGLGENPNPGEVAGVKSEWTEKESRKLECDNVNVRAVELHCAP